jgi:hypothetical protein
MNSEKIRELVGQAKFTAEETINKQIPKNAELDVFAEKFAELIVRECIDRIESQRSSGENTDQWTITRDMCYLSMAHDLKQHFGVE